MCEGEQWEYSEGERWDGEDVDYCTWFDDIVWKLIHEPMV